MNNKNHTIALIAVAILTAGIGFYGGVQYAGSKNQASVGQNQRGQFGGGANGQRQGQGGGFQRQGGQNGAGDFAAGQITAKDDSSITIKTRNGGTQIVFFSSSTSVDKYVSGATADLSIGQQVAANGKSNPDGSISAQNIQIRPAQNQQSQN